MRKVVWQTDKNEAFCWWNVFDMCNCVCYCDPFGLGLTY